LPLLQRHESEQQGPKNRKDYGPASTGDYPGLEAKFWNDGDRISSAIEAEKCKADCDQKRQRR